MCPCSNLYQVYNNNCNNNYSFVILNGLQRFRKPYLLVVLVIRLFAILLITFFVSNTVIHFFTMRIFKHLTCLHTVLTELIVTRGLLCAFLYLSIPNACLMQEVYILSICGKIEYNKHVWTSVTESFF